MFVIEPVFFDEVNEIITELNEYFTKTQNIMISAFYVILNNDNLFSASQEVCEKAANGITAIIDLSVGSYLALRNFAEASKIPYIQLSLSYDPIFSSISTYLREKGVTDYFIVFENEKGKFQKFFKI